MGVEPKGEGDDPKPDNVLVPNVDVGVLKRDDAVADVEGPKADEVKAGADVVPNPVKVEVFGANGLEGIEEEKGLVVD